MGATFVSAAVARVRSLLRGNDGAFFLPAGAVLIVAAIAAVGGTIWQLRADALAEAQRNTSNLALVLAEQTERSVQAIDLVLRELQDDFTRMNFNSADSFEQALGEESIHRRLAARLARLSQADALVVVGADGKLVSSSRSWPAPSINFSDRDYFLHFRTDVDPRMFISIPVKNRITGTWTISLVRSLNAEGGQFLGLVIAIVDLQYFETIFNAIDLPRHETFALLRRDGTMLIRHPDNVERAGYVIPPNSPWFEVLARGGGTYLAPGRFDGRERVVVLQPLRDYPLVLDVGVTQDAALAVWRGQALFIVAARCCCWSMPPS